VPIIRVVLKAEREACIRHMDDAARRHEDELEQARPAPASSAPGRSSSNASSENESRGSRGGSARRSARGASVEPWRESASVKARRYLGEARLTVLDVGPDRVRATCRGQGAVYVVEWSGLVVLGLLAVAKEAPRLRGCDCSRRS
jgi:hypothetical protein